MGKIGPAYLLNVHGDLSFLKYFFDTALGGEHSGKFEKTVPQLSFLRNHV